jgi:hypothetical protein
VNPIDTVCCHHPPHAAKQPGNHQGQQQREAGQNKLKNRNNIPLRLNEPGIIAASNALTPGLSATDFCNGVMFTNRCETRLVNHFMITPFQLDFLLSLPGVKAAVNLPKLPDSSIFVPIRAVAKSLSQKIDKFARRVRKIARFGVYGPRVNAL